MKRKIAIFAVRAIGTLAGLQGAFMVYMTAHMAVASGDDNPWFGSIFFVVVPLIIAMVLIWIAYLVPKQANACNVVCWFWPGLLRRTSSAATGSVGDLVRVVRGA